ncbi:hypothetical protein WKI68_25885 [Streptomyces sp. MS1.HAVA.3]|uniref:GNAT family N-acetyltransferase n=1 Tax=Streptomyces caledonius TaxID=3134107 RepID=A0ABU8U7J9_9ACTN
MTASTDGGTVDLTELVSIRDTGAAEWDALAGDAALYSSHLWLKYGEELADCDHRHLVASAGGRPVAALPTHRFTGTVPHFYDPSVLFPGAAEPASPSARCCWPAPGSATPARSWWPRTRPRPWPGPRCGRCWSGCGRWRPSRAAWRPRSTSPTRPWSGCCPCSARRTSW